MLVQARARKGHSHTRPPDVIEQAARQFEIWTGETAPRSVMEPAALESLNHQQ